MSKVKALRQILFAASIAACSAVAVAAPRVKADQAAAQQALRDTATIHALAVVTGADGQPHGQTLEIIAVAPKHDESPFVKISPVGRIGEEMRTSLEEAIRLVKLRDARASLIKLEISFGEKYSAKDGGSAGTAFTLLILSELNTFELADDAAVTGDITVDGKVRPIGGVRPKLHGAAVDNMKLVGIPVGDAPQLDDAVLLEGPELLWGTQVLSMKTIDDAIAVMRKDRDPKLEQALKAFDDLKKTMAKKPVTTLKTDATAKAALAHILELWPTHLSAQMLQKLANGEGPKKLSLTGSLDEAVASMGRMRQYMRAKSWNIAEEGDAQTVAGVRKAVGRLRKICDPAVEDILKANEAYCNASDALRRAEKSHDVPDIQAAQHACDEARAAIRAAILNVVDSQDAMDKLLRGT